MSNSSQPVLKYSDKRKKTLTGQKSDGSKSKMISQLIRNDDELQELKIKLSTFPELQNELTTIKLIMAIKSLNGTNPNNNNLDENDKYIATNIVKKMKTLLENHRFFYFYFLFYKIDEKYIYKIIPYLRYEFYKKGDILFKEGDVTTKLYFLVKGKISFRKKTILINEKNDPQTTDIERAFAKEGDHFGGADIIHDWKQKNTAYCIENCHLISLDKDTFKHYLEDKVVKVETEVKSFLKLFFSNYMTLPAIKIERLIQTSVETNFYKRNEVIYVEGDENPYLYMIYNGEANLIKKISKGEFSVLPIFQFSKEYIKNNARKINYSQIIKSVKNKDNQSPSISNWNNNCTKNKTVNQSILDVLLNKKSYHVISTFNKGFLGGLEVSGGIPKTRYSLLSSSEFTSVFKINLKQIDDDHLNEFMLNLLPIFIDFEKKIHAHIKRIKYIDCNILPEACQKYSKKYTKGNYLFIEEENDKVYKKNIQNIDEKFDVNEGGFIKVNEFNMKLHQAKNSFKELLKENLIKDKKTDSFLKSYVTEQNSKLKFRGVKVNKPYIPKFEQFEKTDSNTLNENTFSLPDLFLEASQTRTSHDNLSLQNKVFCTTHNSKTYFYTLSTSELIQKLKNRCFTAKKRENISKKSQEMFDKILPEYQKNLIEREKRKEREKKHKINKLVCDTSRGINTEINFNDMKGYMRNLIVKKPINYLDYVYNNKFNVKKDGINRKRIHSFAQNIEIGKNPLGDENINNYSSFKIKRKGKSKPKDGPKKLIFYNTGKYDIPLFTKINEK